MSVCKYDPRGRILSSASDPPHCSLRSLLLSLLIVEGRREKRKGRNSFYEILHLLFENHRSGQLFRSRRDILPSCICAFVSLEVFFKRTLGNETDLGMRSAGPSVAVMVEGIVLSRFLLLSPDHHQSKDDGLCGVQEKGKELFSDAIRDGTQSSESQAIHPLSVRAFVSAASFRIFRLQLIACSNGNDPGMKALRIIVRQKSTIRPDLSLSFWSSAGPHKHSS